MIEMSSCNRDLLACKAENIYRLALCRGSLPTLVLDNYCVKSA